MAELGTVFVDVKGDWSGFTKEAALHGEAAGKKVSSSFGSAVSTGLKVAAAGAGVAIAGIGAYGIKAAADFQQTRIAFEGIFGDTKKAASFLKDLQAFAAKTPFELPGLQKVAKQLLATGTAAQDVIPVLTTIGNVAATLGVGEQEIQGVVRALGQMKGKGKASAEELQQISEQIPGFSAIKAIAESLGITTEEAFKKMQKGAISADTAIGAILEGMEKFPGAAGAMDRQSKTLNGTISTMKDEFRNALIEGIEPYLPKITDLANKVIPLIGPAIRGVIGAFEFLGKAIAGVVETAETGIGAIVGAFQEGDVTSDGWVGVMERIGIAIRGVVDYVTEHWPTVAAIADEVFDTVWRAAERVVLFFQENWDDIQHTVEDVWNAIVIAFEFVTEKVIPALIVAFEETRDWVVEWFPKIRDTVVDVFDKIWHAGEVVVAFFQEHWPKVQAVVGSVVSFIVEEVWPKLKDAYETAKVELEKLVAFFSERWEKIKEATVNFGKVMLAAFIVMFAPIVQVVMSTWENIKDLFDVAFDQIKSIVQNGLKVVKGFIDVFIGVLTLDWQRAWDGIKQILGGVWESLKSTVTNALKIIRETIEGALSVLYDTWKRLWGLIGGWVQEHVFTPINMAVTTFVNGLKRSFETVVGAIGNIWNGLREAFAAPIRFVVNTVYNNGIRKVWNLIPGIPELDAVTLPFNTGGKVPGSGPDKDSVPAYLTPGEFVVNRKATNRFDWLLEEINRNPKTLELNAGGYVHSPAETLAFARTKHGQPYEAYFGGRHRQGNGLGPYGYDCSGFMGELIAYAKGLPLGRRWFTASAFPSTPPMGLVRGMGENSGFNLGIRRATSSKPIGHTAGTIMGVGVESTPPMVRVGNYGKTAMSFPLQYHLPGFGGARGTGVGAGAGGGGGESEGPDGGFIDFLAHELNPIPAELIAAVKEFVALIANGLGGMGSGEIADPLKGVVRNIAGSFLGEVKDQMSSFAGDFLSVVPGLGPLITAASNIPGFATGGRVGGALGAPMLSVNHGGERVLDVATNRAFESLVAAGGDGAFLRPVELVVQLDSREIARATYDPLRQITRERT